MTLGKSCIFDSQHLQLENGDGWGVGGEGDAISHLTGDYKMVYCMGGEATS